MTTTTYNTMKARVISMLIARLLGCLLIMSTVHLAAGQGMARVGHESIIIQGDSAVVQLTLTPKAATTLLANQIPARRTTEVDAGGEMLLVIYDAEARTYTVEEETYTRIAEVRKYARMWLRGVLGVR